MTFDAVLRAAHKSPDDLYDGIALEACRAILSGDLLRMGLNCLNENMFPEGSLRFTHEDFPIGDESTFTAHADRMYRYLMRTSSDVSASGGPSRSNHTVTGTNAGRPTANPRPFFSCMSVEEAVRYAIKAAFLSHAPTPPTPPPADTPSHTSSQHPPSHSSHVTAGFMDLAVRARYISLLREDALLGPVLEVVRESVNRVTKGKGDLTVDTKSDDLREVVGQEKDDVGKEAESVAEEEVDGDVVMEKDVRG